jgi:protein-disulfide isomerase
MASRKEQKERLRAQRLRREAEDEANRRRRRLVQYGTGAAFVAICVVVALIIVSQSGGSSAGSGTKDAGLIARQLKGLSQRGTSLGDPKAKVSVVEYGDLQCPVCKAFSFDVAPSLVSDVVRKGTADYQFRQFTIIGPDSVVAAKAALAAGAQGRYWNFVELFFRNQGQENSGYVTNGFLESVARGAGVRDIARWNADRKSSKWDPVLSKVQSQAQSLGLSATPSIVVQGPRGTRVVGSGVLPLSQIEEAISAVQ